VNELLSRRSAPDPLAGELSAMRGRRVVVVGDVMLDAYLIGPIDRISPEAPVPVLEIEREEFKLGGAANVASCLAALDAQVVLCGVIGDDEHGRRLIDTLRQAGIESAGLVVDDGRPTTTKTRVVARQQQVVRLDHESRRPLEGAVEASLMASVRAAIRDADAVVLSDYSKGALTTLICQAAIEAADGAPVVVDPKDLPWERFRGATVVKPNRREAEQFLGTKIDDDSAAAGAALRLAEALAVDYALITRGGEGMTLAARGISTNSAQTWPAQPRELVDVTGAGDVVAAALALALAAGCEVRRAAWLANVAAGVKVGKFGAAAVTAHEIASHSEPANASARKVMTRAGAADLAARLRAQGRRVVFTNGCFDLLHMGHVTCLERSRQMGDALIVAVNSDASVRRLKGPTRPVQSELDRAQIIAAQACVDAVVMFDEDTPLELIRDLRPDVLTKGADYQSPANVVGADLVAGWGGHVELIDLVAGRSTTRLIDRAA